MTDPISSRAIGTTGVEVTELGFGSAPMGAMGPRLGADDVDALLDTAWQSGIRYYDTAPLYGHGLSEKLLGRVLASKPRDEFTISTKVGRVLVPPDQGGVRYPGMRDEEPFNALDTYSYDGAMRSFEDSLERLQLDRVDILLCHDICRWTHGDAQPAVYAEAAAGAIPALVELRDQGVVGAVGLGVNEWQVCSRVLDEFPVDVFLLAGRFTLLEQESLDEFLPKCVERDAKVIIGGPYNGGLLTNIDRRKATYDYRPASDEMWDLRCRIAEVCEAHDVDLRAAALQYPLRHPAVAAVIPGARFADEAADNAALMAVDIPDDLWSDLESAGLSRSW